MENPSRTISLSRSVVVTEEHSIPSLLLLGKLVSDGSPADSAASLPDKLREIWGPSGTVNFWPVTDGVFLVQFYKTEDLTKAHDGTPWRCGDDLFFMQHVISGMNMVDQIAGFTKGELWVQFHGVPQEYFSTMSVNRLAGAIGDLISHTPCVHFLRARILVDITRPLKSSVDITLEPNKRASVSVEYEGVPKLCPSCRTLIHPLDRCRQPAATSHLGYLRSGASSSSSSSSSSLRGENCRPYEADNLPVFSAAPAAQRPGKKERPPSSPNTTCFTFFKLRSWIKGVVNNKSSSSAGRNYNSGDEIVLTLPSYNEEKQVLLDTSSSQERVEMDKNTDPVDPVAHLLPKTRSKSRFAETQTKPDSPARFIHNMEIFHDANCKDASHAKL